jgi:hypothetical protein
MPRSADEILDNKNKYEKQRSLVVESWVPGHLGDIWLAIRQGLIIGGKKGSDSTAPTCIVSAPNRF